MFLKLEIVYEILSWILTLSENEQTDFCRLE